MNAYGEPLDYTPRQVKVRLTRPATGSSLELLQPREFNEAELIEQYPGWTLVEITVP